MEKIATGQIVVLVGLKGRTDLNGEKGLTMTYIKTTHRFAVKLISSGELKSIRAENLQLCDPLYTRIASTALGEESNCATFTQALLKRRLIANGYPLSEIKTHLFKEEGLWAVSCFSIGHHFVFQTKRTNNGEVYTRVFSSFVQFYNGKEGLKYVKWMNQKERQAFFDQIMELEKWIRPIGKRLEKQVGNGYQWLENFEAITKKKRSDEFQYVFDPEGKDMFLVRNVNGKREVELVFKKEMFDEMMNKCKKIFHGALNSTISKMVGQNHHVWMIHRNDL